MNYEADTYDAIKGALLELIEIGNENNYIGVPTLVVEVLSPSTTSFLILNMTTFL